MSEELLVLLNELSKRPTTELAMSYMEIVTDNIEKGKEIERLNNMIEKLEQENAVLKTQVVNKDKYSYGIRIGSDKA